MSRINRRQLLASGGALAGAGLIRTSAFSQSAASVKRGGTVTIGMASFPTGLAGFLSTGTPQNIVCPKINEGLLAYDFDLKPIPKLAQSWSVSPDGLIYTFKLRPNVRWHDGREFTSADVAFSMMALKEVHPRGRSTFSTVKSIETPDAFTAMVTLSEAKPFLIMALAGSESPMVPKHVYEGTDLRTNPANNAPVGTGPYKFKEWSVGSHIILERNPEYWDAPKPYVDRLVFRIFTDIGSRVVSLESGDVDIAGQEFVPLADLQRLVNQPHLELMTEGFSYVPTMSSVQFNLKRPMFADKRVRQAIAHLIDRNFIARALWYGRALPSYGPISPFSKDFYATDLPTYAPDLAKAEALLDQAGFKRGANGTRFSVALDYYPDEPAYRAESEYLKQQLSKAGIIVTIRSQDVSAYTKRIFMDHDFDFTKDGYSTQFDPAVGVQRYYYSPLYNQGIPFVNPMGYNNPEVDRLLEQAAVEVNVVKRTELYKRFQHIVADELPVLAFVSPYKFAVYNNRIADAITTSNGTFGDFADVKVVSG